MIATGQAALIPFHLAVTDTGDAMFCLKCGHQLPDDAAFCLKCGAPQGAQAATAAPVQEVQGEEWEECEVVAKKGIIQSEFVAEVFGPKGHYIADKIKCNLDMKNGWREIVLRMQS